MGELTAQGRGRGSKWGQVIGGWIISEKTGEEPGQTGVFS